MVEHPFVGLGMTPLGLLQRAAQTRLLPDGRPNLHRQRRHLLILGLLPLLQFDRLVLQPAALPLHRRGLLGGQAGAGGQAVQVRSSAAAHLAHRPAVARCTSATSARSLPASSSVPAARSRTARSSSSAPWRDRRAPSRSARARRGRPGPSGRWIGAGAVPAASPRAGGPGPGPGSAGRPWRCLRRRHSTLCADSTRQGQDRRSSSSPGCDHAAERADTGKAQHHQQSHVFVIK
mmetsp:Transcript_12166/g.20278  ORF Transcript_12166/g.20278 Transcript_12166/m.20278 type:complete len:234 (+) Transcript_12166:323-1024(+)